MRQHPVPVPPLPSTGTVLDVQRVIATGHHNAFCSLARWRGHDYLAFRQAQGHNPVFPGTIQIWRRPAHGAGLASDTLAPWQPCAALATGGDDRDPKLVSLGDVLGCVWGTYVPRWGVSSFARTTIPNAACDLLSHCSVSRDGVVWSVPQQVYRPNYWLWSVVPEQDEDGAVPWLHALAYHFGEPQDTGCLVHLQGPSLTLLRTQQWLVLDTPEAPAEPALLRDIERKALAVCVRNGDIGNALWGERAFKAQQFLWTFLPEPVHAPALLASPWGTLVAGRLLRDAAAANKLQKAAAQRGYQSTLEIKTAVWERREGSERWVTGLALRTPQGFWCRLLTLPSWGDTGYPGLLWEEQTTLSVAYYSQHDRKAECDDLYYPHPADIYVARVRLEAL